MNKCHITNRCTGQLVAVMSFAMMVIDASDTALLMS
jgi:hypothetical protein